MLTAEKNNKKIDTCKERGMAVASDSQMDGCKGNDMPRAWICHAKIARRSSKVNKPDAIGAIHRMHGGNQPQTSQNSLPTDRENQENQLQKINGKMPAILI